MAQNIKYLKIKNTRLLKIYASWIYCDKCNNTIGYLCYVTYDRFEFHYTCKCKNSGSIIIEKDDAAQENIPAEEEMITIKNRLCCPEDHSPLITILTNKLESYSCEIVCKECGKLYKKEG
jgi:hypothetical protein